MHIVRNRLINISCNVAKPEKIARASVFHFPEASIANHLTVLESSIQQTGQRQSIHQIQERAIKNAKDEGRQPPSLKRTESCIFIPFARSALFHLSRLLGWCIFDLGDRFALILEEHKRKRWIALAVAKAVARSLSFFLSSAPRAHSLFFSTAATFLFHISQSCKLSPSLLGQAELFSTRRK